MSDQDFAIIMAGGKGERFWPQSTSKHPKQVLSLVGGKPLLQIAVDRLDGILPVENIYVITSADLVGPTQDAAPEIPKENIIGEPVGRDTAAAVALGAAIVNARAPKGAFAVLTADHIIGDLDQFQNTLATSFEIARSRAVLITIGVKPTFPATGYGYIETDGCDTEKNGLSFFSTGRFVEKPDEQTAVDYIESGIFYWNSGMFIWSVTAITEALSRHQPPLGALIEAMSTVVGHDSFQSTLKTEYDKLEKISIDYAVMEKADNILMVQGTFSWDDVGAWPALANHFDHDEHDNVLIGQCETIDAAGNIVVSKGHLTAIIGVDDLVVVQAEGATLVCHKSRAQDVKQMVQALRKNPDYKDLV